MNVVKKRLREYINYKLISAREFCRKIEAAPNFLGNDCDISTDKVIKILSNFPDINLNWLILGRGQMIIDVNPEQVKSAAKTYVSDMVAISGKLGDSRGLGKVTDDSRLWSMVDCLHKQLEVKDNQIEVKDRQLEAKDKQLEAKDKLLASQMQMLESFTRGVGQQGR